jgi:hypothetical protein
MNAPVSITPYGSVATVRVLLPVPDRLNVEKRPFNAVDQDLPIVAVAGRQRRRTDCGERIERRVQPRGVFSLAVSAQIINFGIVISTSAS